MKPLYRHIALTVLALLVIVCLTAPSWRTVTAIPPSVTDTGLCEPEQHEPTPYIPRLHPETQAVYIEAVENAGPTRVYIGKYYVTGYDVCVECCGKTDGITAGGTLATVGRTCAANGLPFGTVLYIDGIGERVVEDRGGMQGAHLDVLCADHPTCYAITGWYDVYIVEAAALGATK